MRARSSTRISVSSRGTGSLLPQYAQYGPFPMLDAAPSYPIMTVRPRKKGRPQSKFPGKEPPISTNTWLNEFKVRFVKLPIWKGTGPLGAPEAPVFVAERFWVAAGQNQAALPGQLGSWLAEGGVKNNPFEPLSMKLL